MVDISSKDSTDEEIIDILLPVEELRRQIARYKELLLAEERRGDKHYDLWQAAQAEVERLRAAIDEVLASLDEYETHHRHAYTMKCIRRVIARLAIPTY